MHEPSPDTASGDLAASSIDASLVADCLSAWTAAQDNRVVVVDTHPGANPLTDGAIEVLDLLLIPVVLGSREMDVLEGMLGDFIESRIQRRERSIRPPRRPRDGAKGRSEQAGTPETPEQPSSATSTSVDSEQSEEVQRAPSDDQPTSAQETEARPPGSSENHQMAEQHAAGQGHGVQLLEQPDVDQLEAALLDDALQRQITDAVAPIIEDLQQQMTEAIRQQSQLPVTGTTDQEGMQKHVGSGPVPERQQAQEQENQSVDPTEKKDPEAAERSRLQTVIGGIVAALRRAVKALVSLIRTIGRKLGAALGFVVGLLGRIVASVLSRLWIGLKSLLATVIQKLVLSRLQ